jgi:hypothetical protein
MPGLSILDLPTEVLLEIGNHFHGLDQNSNLKSLSLVNQRFRSVAQEKLLCNPSFHLTHIYNYMFELGQNTRLLGKVQKLEIFNSREGQSKHRVSYGNYPTWSQYLARYTIYDSYPQAPSPLYMTECTDIMDAFKNVIGHFTREGHNIQTRDDRIAQLEWLNALEDDDVHGLLGILLVALPNLKELCIGATWLMDFPIFSHILTNTTTCLAPLEWSRRWTKVPLATLFDKLEVLELPADITGLLFSRPGRDLLNLHPFHKLKHLGLSMDMINAVSIRSRAPPNPTHFLPPSLELLRISECTELTTNFINELCLARKKGHFPKLQQVDLYFWKSFHTTEYLINKFHCIHPIDMRQICSDASLALYMYMPFFRQRTEELAATPWSLDEAGVLEGREWKRWGHLIDDCMYAMGSFSVAWDADGDTIMSG